MVDDIIKGMAFSLNEKQIVSSYMIILICGLFVNLGIDLADRVDPRTFRMLKSLRMQTFETLIRVNSIYTFT